MSSNHCIIIAEGCCNHQGNIETAIEMTHVAKLCNANYIKWQKRNPVESVPQHIQNQPHPNPVHSFGKTYLEHRQNLEFSIEQHKILKDEAEKINIKYSCSVWDITSAKQIISLDPDYIKIPAASNNNYKLLDFLLSSYTKEIHISLGMTTHQEREHLINKITPFSNRVVLYHTTTEYPCPFENLFLLDIQKLKSLYPNVGYSGHNYGIAADVAAYTLGAKWIERHFTLDRTMKGTDHAASLEPDGLRKLCRDIKNIELTMRFKPDHMTTGEQASRHKLKIEHN